MRILGISTIGRGSAVALLEEKSILFAIEEEKLNRLQDALEIPRLALERCLHENQLKLADFRAIALAERSARAFALPRQARHALRFRGPSPAASPRRPAALALRSPSLPRCQRLLHF